MDGCKPGEVLIHIRDLWKAYNQFQVLKGLSLDIYKGETLVILGRSGVGKSVLLRQIIGIETPDEGCVEIGGVNVSGISDLENYKSPVPVGMLFQSAALFDSMTVRENTSFYLTQHPDPLTGEWISPEEIDERSYEALSLVGLEGTGDKMPSELSGGMKKRAALARLIVYKPQILLYDEPTTGLDPVTASQINELINETQSKLKATSIVVTHDIKSALSIGDRFAFHHDGKIIFVGDKKSFLHSTDPLVSSFFEKAILTEETLNQ